QDGLWLVDENSNQYYWPYTNVQEFENGTDPHDKDTDSDSLPDGWEALYGSKPLVDDTGDDPDIDMLTNLEEYNLGTNPTNNDTDNDRLDDWDELNIYMTDPLDRDFDDDDMSDGFEIEIAGTDPKTANHKYAILFNTGDPNAPNKDWEDSQRMFELLKQHYSYNNSEIWKYENQAATSTNLKNAIYEVAALADENDTVYINIASHGSYNQLICNDLTINYTTLDSWLDEINCSKLIISIDNCRSGTAISRLEDGDNPCDRVIYTACKSNELSDGSFHWEFTDALGKDKTNYQEADENFGDEDGDGNGYVSVREAFLYAAEWVNTHVDVDLDGEFDTSLESDSSVLWETVYLGEYR
ncbi:MAG: hypothetical protein KAJ51_10140, partial [Thermoplasmata archaeon]|nr:hypothetical protein [Thermoplasmata archaeon]